MILLNVVTDFLNNSWISNLIGLSGGILGLWTFIDSYLMIFNPKIYIGTKVIIDTIEEDHSTQLNSIICSLEICNHRKKYGTIYDFAIRIYNSEIINPPNRIYYASETIDKIPVQIAGIINQERCAYNPITVTPISNTSVNLVLSEILYQSKLNITARSNYYIEVYFQKKPKGKWHFVEKLYLFNKGELEISDKKYLHFITLESDITREKLNKHIKPQKTSLYSGVSQKIILFKLKKYSYKLIKYPLYRIKDIFISFPFYLNFLINAVIDTFIKIPIIKHYSKNVETPRIKIGSPESKPITETAFDKIYVTLNELIKKINIDAKKEVIINVKKEADHIILTRYKLSIKLYISGDSSIRVQELNSSRGSRLSYHIYLKEKVWNNKYWFLENYGFITINSFVVRILDAFVVHSNY